MGLIRAGSSPLPNGNNRTYQLYGTVTGRVRVVNRVQDSILLERMDACNHCAVKPYHWIEDGTHEDFKRNIMESDLPLTVFGFASTATCGANFELLGFDLVNRPEPMALMGTYVMRGNEADLLPFRPLMQGQVVVRADLAQVEPSVIQMLLARPEVQEA